MKIAFDAKRAAQNRTGLGNYSRFIVRILRRFAPQHDYLLCIPNPARASQLADLPQAGAYTRVSPRTPLGRRFSSLWRTLMIPRELRRQGVALYHGLSNELPLGIRRAGIPSVVTIHDVIFLHCPEYYKPVDRLIYRLKFRYAARVADRIIAVSQYTKHELIRWLNVPAAKIDVPNAISWADVERDLTAWIGNDMERDAIESVYALHRKVTAAKDKGLMRTWRRLQTSDHFYYMCTKWFSDGDVHKYFNPYGTPYDAYINYMNVLSDFKMTLEA